MGPPTQTMHDAVVVGAGPAGLAVARELQHHHGISVLIVDRASAPAMAWRTRYDNFRLNTNGFMSHLPGQRIPWSAGRWPTKEDMVRYFDRYVQRHRLRLRLGCTVNRIDRSEAGWVLDTSTGSIAAKAVVLATGNYRTPTVPAWQGLGDFTGTLIHSADFVNAWPHQGRDVLVVGSGNSAADIAVQLADSGAGQIWLSVRTPPHLVRRAMGPIPSDLIMEMFSWLPASAVDPLARRFIRQLWGDLSAYGLREPPLGLKATIEQRGRIPTLADELVDHVRGGRVDIVAAVDALDGDRVLLADGSALRPQVIVAATGFHSDLDGMLGHLGVLNQRGKPRGGFSSHLGEGMFALGYGVPAAIPLRKIRRHATPLAREVANHLRSHRQPPGSGSSSGCVAAVVTTSP